MLTQYRITTSSPAVFTLILFSLLANSGCVGADTVKNGPEPGTPEWYATASEKSRASYFRGQCIAFGHMPGTPEMADCIHAEATAAGQSGVAKAAGIAAATSGN